MEILDEIKSSLANNTEIEQDIKDKLFQLTIIFNSKFPNIPLDKLNNKLKTVKIGRVSKYEKIGNIVYDIKQNIILIAYEMIKESDYDLDNLFMKVLLCMITCNGVYCGFNSNYQLEALNEAYTEILANYLVGNEGNTDLEEEILITNLISHIIGKDTLFNAYFTNNGNQIIKIMNEVEANV